MNTDPKQRLYARAVLDASKAYIARCRDLRAMRPSLELFEADLPALQQRQIAPQPDQIHWIPFPASLSVHMACRDDANRFHAALQALNYVECSREDFVSVSLVALTKGALRISISIYPMKAAA